MFSNINSSHAAAATKFGQGDAETVSKAFNDPN
jgi:hypothetical protein